MPRPRTARPVSAAEDAGGDAPRVVAPCPGCGSVACAVTGLEFCRHTGTLRDPDPAAFARRTATRMPGPLIPLEAAS